MRVPFPVRAVPFLTFRAWLTPPPVGAKTSARDREVLDSIDVTFVDDIPVYEIGSGPLIVALHGWGGRPSQMIPLARRLAGEGFRVVIPELPGHAGDSQTDIKKAAGALRSVLEQFGRPEVIVAHSFAAMVLRVAFPAEGPEALVLVAPALNVNDALEVFSDRLRLLPWSRRGLRTRLERWDPDLWPVVSSTNPDVLTSSDILILHDPNDPDTPFARSAELAALRSDVTLLPAEGAGHNRILGDDATQGRVADFVRQRVVDIV